LCRYGRMHHRARLHAERLARPRGRPRAAHAGELAAPITACWRCGRRWRPEVVPQPAASKAVSATAADPASSSVNDWRPEHIHRVVETDCQFAGPRSSSARMVRERVPVPSRPARPPCATVLICAVRKGERAGGRAEPHVA